MLRKSLVFLLLYGHMAVAAPKWIAVRSENFELYTTGGERAARDTLRHFEMVRTFFLQALKLGGASAPAQIIAFDNRKHYEEYAPQSWSAAFYHAGPDRDMIVMSGLGPETGPTAIHEYVHLLIKHSEIRFPLWINEGYAELYSSLQPKGNKAMVGAPIEGHYRLLSGSKWPPLQNIWDAEGYGHSGKNGAVGAFYALSWALMHMMNLSDGYRPKSGEWMNLVVGGMTAAEAFQKVYGKTPDQVTSDLRNYMGQSRVNGALFDVALKKNAEKPEAAPADMFVVDLSLAELLVRRDPKKARERLEALGAQKADHAAVWSALAQVAMLEKGEAAARAHLDKAFAVGKLSPRMLRNYAYLLRAGTDKERRLEVLQEVIRVEPNDVDARLSLISAAMQMKNYKLAVEHLTKMRSVKPESAQFVFHSMAIAAHELDDVKGATAAAKRLRQIAKTPEEMSNANRLAEYVAKTKSEWAAAAQAPASRPAAMAHLPEADFAAGQELVEIPRLEAKGRLTQMDCLGQQARITVTDGEQRPLVLLIEDPNNIVIRQAAAGPVDLECGPQTMPKAVTVEFEQKANLGDGVAGVLRVLAIH